MELGADDGVALVLERRNNPLPALLVIRNHIEVFFELFVSVEILDSYAPNMVEVAQGLGAHLLDRYRAQRLREYRVFQLFLVPQNFPILVQS